MCRAGPAPILSRMNPSYRIHILAAALLPLAFASAADAKSRQAWDVQSVTGQYTIEGSSTEPISCQNTDPEDYRVTQVTNGKYVVNFSGRDLGRRGPYFKYFPFLRGPASPGPVGVGFDVTRTATENLRTVEHNDPCVQSDKPCSATSTARTSQTPYALGALTKRGRVRIGVPIIGSRALQPSCVKDASRSLQPEYPGDSISPQMFTYVPLSHFRRRSLTITMKGSRRVGGGQATAAFGGTLTWSATVKLRKVTLREGCREIRGRTGFACSD